MVNAAGESSDEGIVEVAAEAGLAPQTSFSTGRTWPRSTCRPCAGYRRPPGESSCWFQPSTHPAARKTTVSIGLTQGLRKIGKNAANALREPSLGPIFGVKGGARRRQVHAGAVVAHQYALYGRSARVTSAHNLLAAMVTTRCTSVARSILSTGWCSGDACST